MTQGFASYDDVRRGMYGMDPSLRATTTQENLDYFISANFTGGGLFLYMF